MENILRTIEKQNKAIISLLARIAFKEKGIIEIVIYKKRNPRGYINVYNALDGNKTVTDLAKIAKVDQSTMTPILQDWEASGIILNMADNNKPKHIGLMHLSEYKTGANRNDKE